MGNPGNGLYSGPANLAAVALPQNAVIVMATTSAVSRGGSGEEAGPGRSLSLTGSGRLLLSPSLSAPPASAAPSPPSSSSPAPPPAPAGVATLSLTLLPSPVIGSLLLTPSSCSSPPTAPGPCPPSPCPPPPALPPAFDPDSFLNSPKQGETYGGLPPPGASSGLSSLLCSSSPFSPVSLSLSLSPPSTPPSSVSPRSSSSSGETDRRGSSLPPTVTLSPSPSVAPPLLPLCLELSALGGGAGGGGAGGADEEMKDGELGAPPADPPQQQTGSGVAPLLLVGQGAASPPLRSADRTRRRAEAGRGAVLGGASRRLPHPDPAGNAPPPPTAAPAAEAPAEVKQEVRGGYDRMDAQLEGEGPEAGPCEQGGEELDISFDSQFPDLMSELITEEAPPPADPPSAAPPASHASVFPMGVRYMVPPQPSPSSSFLPFPHPLPSSSSGGLASITDFSPEWSYPEGGVKVLITGPWSELSGRYSCVFDQSTVAASLIQPGVLRCYCPAHEAGLVCLQVLEPGGSASSSVLFEYRARNTSSLPSSQLDWLSLDDNQFRMSILERLEQMERRMAEMSAESLHQQQHHRQQFSTQLATPPPPLPEEHVQASQWFERRIVGVCERMMRGGRWGGGGERLPHAARHRGMTLLHLAAAQGYTHLIHTLIHWRTMNNDSLDLEQEVDPLNIDHFSCTPLMWACALGHQRAAELLYRWDSSALGIPDSLGRLPLAVARSRGHTRLASALEELHTRALSPAEPGTLPPPSPSSSSLDTGLSSSSSLPSPSDPSSPSPSSAYSSGPAPMDTSPSSPSSPSSLSSLVLSPPVPSPLPLSSLPAVSMLGEELHASLSTGLSADSSRDFLFFMDYKSSCPRGHVASGGRGHVAASLEEQLLSYGENAENEGEEVEYLEEEEEELQVDMATLAEQIIQATPERIKQEDFPRGGESLLRERQDNVAMQDTWLATYLETVDTRTHPPPRRVRPPSPLSALALQRLRPPSSAAWAEFLNASANGKMERDFALLTLTDGEQRELYEAARIIQNAFRRYKGRKLKEQQDVAAAVIQRCYRKYKQYALYKKMTQAAILIQSKFRSYYEQKRFQQSRRAAVLIQQYYRSYKEYERLKQASRGASAHNPKLKGTFLTKKQDQAARKIMRFLRRCRHRIKELKQSKELERRGLTT